MTLCTNLECIFFFFFGYNSIVTTRGQGIWLWMSFLEMSLRLCLFLVKITSGNAFPEMRLFGWSGKFYFPEIEIRWPKKKAFDHGIDFTLLFSLQSIFRKMKERERERQSAHAIAITPDLATRSRSRSHRISRPDRDRDRTGSCD